jgi:hypothetical protein
MPYAIRRSDAAVGKQAAGLCQDSDASRLRSSDVKLTAVLASELGANLATGLRYGNQAMERSIDALIAV